MKNIVYIVAINWDLHGPAIKSWEYWCKKHNCEFYIIDEPIVDVNAMAPHWQRYYIYDILENENVEYDNILYVDADAIVSWDAPNFFDMTENKFCGIRDTDNMKWVYDSIKGYEPFFDFKLNNSKYVNSGVIIFNKSHRKFFESFKELYYNNSNAFIELQDIHVKKGTEQTPFNYWLQKSRKKIRKYLK